MPFQESAEPCKDCDQMTNRICGDCGEPVCDDCSAFSEIYGMICEECC